MMMKLLIFLMVCYSTTSICQTAGDVYNGPTQVGNNNSMYIHIDTAYAYANMSRLNIHGREFECGVGIGCSDNELTLLMKKVTIDTLNRTFPRLTDSSLFYSSVVIEKFPRFPFGYYCMAVMLHEFGVSEWEAYARKAIEILSITRKFDGHDETHDQAFDQLTNLLQQKTPK